MSIVIGADAAGLRLKDLVKEFLVKENFDVVDVTAEGQDFVDVTLAVASEVNKNDQNLGIVIDAYGAGPFMVATKIKGMVGMNWRKTLPKASSMVNTTAAVTKSVLIC